MKIYISVNEHSHGFIQYNTDDDRIIRNDDFELPYDIAENLAYSLSYIAHVELEDENYNNIVIENGKLKIKELII